MHPVIDDALDRLAQWAAWKTPRRLRYWIAIRAVADASVRHPDTPLPELVDIDKVFDSGGRCWR